MMRAMIFLAACWICAACAPNSAEKQPPSDQVPIGATGPRHPVTEKMSSAAAKNSRGTAPSIDLIDVSGNRFRSADALVTGPMVVISIKDGCPCSVDSQPLFNDLYRKFQGKASFVGLFNLDASAGQKYVLDNSVPYSVLVDPELKTIKAFKLERSVYVALVDSQGNLVKQWPGYWIDMLKELDSKLSELTGFKGEPFDGSYAPKDMSSGCQLFVGEGFAEGDKP